MPCLTLLLNLLLLLPVTAGAHQITPSARSTASADTGILHETIATKIDYYNNQFPEIRFVHMDGGADWPDDMIAVISLLGQDATALDFEHPPRLRAALMEVTLERLRRFIRADVVSATMFRAGSGSAVKRPNLCVITLNPQAYFASDYEATRYMLDVSSDTMDNIHPGRYLDRIHHLEFAMDHEAFHCIDSYLNGGAPRTHEEFGGEYNLFRRESIADAYAMAMHIRSHGQTTAYARNLVHARALWLFSDSPNACTFETVRELLRYDAANLQDAPMEDIVELAGHLRDKTVGSYESYLTQRASALAAAQQLGKGPELFGPNWEKMIKQKSSPAQVKFLVNRYRYYYSQLFTDTPIPLEAPPGSGPYPGPAIESGPD